MTIRLGATPSGLTSAHLHHPPYFFTGRMRFLPPNQQCQSTDGRCNNNSKNNTYTPSCLPQISSNSLTSIVVQCLTQTLPPWCFICPNNVQTKEWWQHCQWLCATLPIVDIQWPDRRYWRKHRLITTIQWVLSSKVSQHEPGCKMHPSTSVQLTV